MMGGTVKVRTTAKVPTVAFIACSVLGEIARLLE